MSPSSTSEARKRREGDTDTGPEPLPGYVLTTRAEAARAGWECIDVDSSAVFIGDLDDDDWTVLTVADTSPDDDWLVIARPPRPRTVTVELPEDEVCRLASRVDGSPLTAACRAALDAEQ